METITELQKYHDEISERCDKLLAFIKSDGANLIHEDDRHLIGLEYSAASELLFVIGRRIERARDKIEVSVGFASHNNGVMPKFEWADPSEFWKEEFVI